MLQLLMRSCCDIDLTIACHEHNALTLIKSYTSLLSTKIKHNVENEFSTFVDMFPATVLFFNYIH